MARRTKTIVGELVTFSLAGHRVRATIVEDRGNIGIRGRKLVRVHVKNSDTELELPFEQLKLATA